MHSLGKVFEAATPSIHSVKGSKVWACQARVSSSSCLAHIYGPCVLGSSPGADTSLFPCICRSTNQTYSSAKTPAIITTPQEEDRLSAPDSASPASTPTGESLTFFQE